jgi:hypothetical protein
MARIKVTEEALSKAIYEGVAEAMLPDNQEKTETNEVLDDMITDFELAGERFVRVGEHLSQNIAPEIKTIYASGLEAMKKVFGAALNLSAINSYYSDNSFTARIPVSSLDGYKSYLENEKYYLDEVLREFASEYTNYEGELNNENYEQIKQAFFNNQGWVESSVDEALEKLEEEVNCKYSTLNLSYSQHFKEAWIEIEFPYNIEKYCKFINGEDED